MTIAAAARVWIRRNPAMSDMTLRQLALLDLIASEGPHELQAAAGLLGLSRPVLTRACDALDGYVERQAVPTDARRRVIALTPAGHSLIGLMRIDR